MKRPGILVGALIGLIVTGPLMAVQYLAMQAVGLPFAPFEVFDWLARALPGDVVTFGIDSIVSLISGLGIGDTSATAKSIEQLMAVALFLAAGVVFGAGYYFIQRRRGSGSFLWSGLVLGLVLTLPVLLVLDGSELTSTIAPIFGALWLLVSGLAWGVGVAWITATLLQEPDAAAPGTEAVAGSVLEVGPPVSTTLLDRRQFLIRVGNAAAVVTVVGAGIGALLESGEPTGTNTSTLAGGSSNLPANLPNADAPVQPAPGTRLEYTPIEDHYRIDINLVSPSVNGDDWVLTVDGLVNNPLALPIEELRTNYEAMDQYVTMACISNRVGGDLIGTTRWTGVSLQHILDEAQLHEDAAYLKITSADGFHETVAIDLVYEDERIMLCYDWDGQPLTTGHGFPLRIYIPDRYGMKQPKWINRIEVISEYEEGYWVRRGWDPVARMRTTSVVDTVADFAKYEESGQLLVPVGGIAHAGARGISKVEVKVDEGDWAEAQLRTPLSDTTWVIWRYDWPFQEGRHTFYVRAYDGDNIIQDDTERGSRPSGATGIHSKRATLELTTESD